MVDLSYQHELVAAEVESQIRGLMRRGTFVLGEDVEQFEGAMAEAWGVGHCVGVGNGSDALELALRAAGVGPGDEVVVPTNSFVATAFAVLRAGATLLLSDVEERCLLLDAAALGAHLRPSVRAVIPVHLFGQMAPIDELLSCVGSEVSIIEDASQAHGARRNAFPSGQFTFAATTSFYPAKNLGAFGDAGAVLTNSPDVAEAIRLSRNHGSVVKYEHRSVGFNSRLDSLQAIVLNAKLKYLSVWNEQRRRAAAAYDEMLAALPDVKRPSVLPGNEHVWHLYAMRVPGRDRVLQRLNEAGIEAAVHYPVPIHLQSALRHLGYARGDFPVSESAAQELLSLPLFPGITEEQQARVVEELRRALQ